jgi:hypothetical protein
MDIRIKINQEEYKVSRDIDNPDADNVMFAIESLVKTLPIDQSLVKEYVVAWAEEIQNKRLI